MNLRNHFDLNILLNFAHGLTPLKQKIKFDCIYEKTSTDGSNKFIGGHVHLVNQKEILASELNSLRVHQLFGRCYGIHVFTSTLQLFADHNTHTCYHDHKKMVIMIMLMLLMVSAQ